MGSFEGSDYQFLGRILARITPFYQSLPSEQLGC